MVSIIADDSFYFGVLFIPGGLRRGGLIPACGFAQARNGKDWGVSWRHTRDSVPMGVRSSHGDIRGQTTPAWCGREATFMQATTAKSLLFTPNAARKYSVI